MKVPDHEYEATVSFYRYILGFQQLPVNEAEGTTGDLQSMPQHPNYMVNVGKLFTSTVISLLHEQGELSFNDKISRYLDRELMKELCSSGSCSLNSIRLLSCFTHYRVSCCIHYR